MNKYLLKDKIIRKVNYFKKKIIYKIQVILIFIFFKKKYSIKRGYLHRNKYTYFDDTLNTDEWQKEVYLKAREYAQLYNLNRIIDYGCGSGFKLKKYFNEYDTIGIDLNPTFQFLKTKYPKNKWLKFGDFNFTDLSADIVICSDVIEHVLNPDELINNIKNIHNVKYIFISTPDRNIAPSEKFGPPLNPTHIREWNFEEFKTYISKHLNIIEHLISNNKQWTQLIVAEVKKN